MNKIQRAIISVSDKTNMVEFASALAEMGVEILSTGGTAGALRDAGIAVTDVSEFTGFPEMLDGRVKTLHPHVHAGILFRRDRAEHVQTMKEHRLAPVDLVCVNLYPFEDTIADKTASFEDAIENIDIGGPAMLRSAAKNFSAVTVVVDPADYTRVLEDMKTHQGQTTEALRMELAQKVFARLAAYNAAIAHYLCEHIPAEKQAPPFVLAYGAGTTLRYGENPHQEAALYRDAHTSGATLAHAEQWHGKELSYNNYLDGDAALEAARELADQTGVAIIKHSNPCGYATGKNLSEAFEAAWAGDPVSAFGSVIAVTRRVTLDMAEQLKGRFVEVLIAPDFDKDALEYLKQKSASLRLLKLTRPLAPLPPGNTVRPISGGLLVQSRDIGLMDNWFVPTETPFPEERRALAEFGIAACKHVKSNAIVIVREYAPGQFMQLGMGAGQPNRVDALRKLALARCTENMEKLFATEKVYGKTLPEYQMEILHDCVLVSDAFFPFADSIEYAAEAGIRNIVQPGGSKRDEEVISKCDQYGIAMAFTGMRHFRH